MFTQAGFREDYKLFRDTALVCQPPSKVPAEARLIRWSTGEIAFASHTKICWPEQVQIIAASSELIAQLESSGAAVNFPQQAERGI